ncbi:MAG TPA: TonB-dependent receptor [Flavisolibacter sp.]
MRKIFAVTALFISSTVLAQDTTTLNEVVVTANKFSSKTTQTGKVVTVITRQDIERAGSRDLAQVLTEQGGIYINGYTGSPGKDKNIYIRGAKYDYSLITVDGIPVYDASGTGSNFDIRNISIDQVERIEILKGSQSTLYGSDAIAGVINIITRKGGAKPFGISGTAHYGSYNTYRASLGVNGRVKAFDYNIGYSGLSTDGFSEARPPAASSAVFDRDGFEQNSVQASFGIQATPNLRISPYFRHTRNKADLDQDAFTDELDYTSSIKNLQTGIRNEIGIGNARLNVLYNFVRTNRHYHDDSTLSRNGFYTFNTSDFQANEHFAEAFVVYPFSQWKLTAGADFRRSVTEQLSENNYGTSKMSGDSISQRQVSAYAALNYQSETWNVEGGGRFNHHSEYGSNFAFNFNPSYLIRKQVKLFANVSTGYKTPSLYQLFSIYGNRELDPETSLNLEGGVQYFTKDEKVSLRAVYFNRYIKDAIAFFFDPVTFESRYINQDEQKDHGFEIDGRANISDKMQVRVLYSFVDGEITTKQNGKDTTYFNLIRRPRNLLNLSLGSQVTKSLYLNAQITAAGERQDLYFDPSTFQSVPVTLKSYVVVNFYAEYGFLNNRLKLFADLRNISDEDYSDIYGYNTARFNAYGGIRFQF